MFGECAQAIILEDSGIDGSADWIMEPHKMK